MSRTVTALYDTRAEAEAARQRLSSEFNLGSARIIDQASRQSGSSDGSLDRIPMSQEDRHAYGEAIRRGGFMLTAEVRGHEEADKIIRLLEDSAATDLDQRQELWRREGWSPQRLGSGGASPATAPSGPAGSGAGEARIPVVEEELVLGKREVERGGARVRSYVREVPVHEQVTLREEHVSVERHPVDQRLSASELAGSDLLRERQVEVTAIGEEPVVEKEARVREEVVVRKIEDRHVEQVADSVSKTEVDVDGAASGRQNDTPTTSRMLDAELGDSRPTPATTPLMPAVETFERREEAADVGSSPFPTQEAQMPIEHEMPAYQPAPAVDVIEVTEQRASRRPSRKVVIGSALAGAVAGGAIPFMLAGRRSAARRRVAVVETSEAAFDEGYDPARDPGTFRRQR